ncbi:MAG: PLP-dependent aminotransferase family protein [Hyphomicrobiaceae bacterium]|nr:PLP-dependent aminotransferase family protein [Hyphomicrobiaceae bacterium]
MRASEIRELLKLLEQPGIISFAGGIPDPELFPKEAINAAYHGILANEALAAQALQYSVSEGYRPLREWIASHMASRGVPASADNILITSGSQQALEFLGKLFITPGDTALVAAPTYLGALQAFSAYEPRYDTLGPESANRTPASYAEAAATTGGSVKFAYVVPDFANPTGRTMSSKARKGLIALAEELDCVIIEDAAYVDLRFGGETVPAVQALDVARHGGDLNTSRVIYCGTFSKTLTPGLRIGWVCAAKPIVRRLTLIKQACDLNSSLINQMVVERLAAATFGSQVEQASRHYRNRRDAMLAALKHHMPAGVTWTTPEGGLFIWVELPEQCDGQDLLRRAISEAQVAFVPGGAFFTDGTGRNTMRLSYSLPNEAQIEDGIARLGKLIATAA